MGKRTSQVALFMLAAALAAPAVARADDAGGPYSDNFKLADRAKSYAEESARYRDTQARYDDANSDLVEARQAAVAEYQASPAYVAAVKAVTDTYRAYTSKKREVIRQIEQRDPRYAELQKQAAAVEAEIAAARANPMTSIPQFQDLYNKKSVFTREMRALEADALDKANSADLQHQWELASQNLAELRAKQDAAVEQSPGVKAALAEVTKERDELDDLGAKLAGSKAAYVQAQTQQSAADDYLRRSSSYANANDGWGYGWGFTPLYGGTGFIGTGFYSNGFYGYGTGNFGVGIGSTYPIGVRTNPGKGGQGPGFH